MTTPAPHRTNSAVTALNSARVHLPAATLLGKMQRAGRTCYRSTCRREIERFLKVASPCHGGYRVPILTRARLVMIARDLEAVADPAAVFAYLSAIVADEPAAELERLVVETHSAELMRRFARWMPTADRAHLRASIRVAEVMGA